MRTFLLLTLLVITVRSNASTALVVETDKDVYRVGELGLVTLRIEGAEIDPVPAAQPGFVSPTEATLFSSISADTGFAYRFRWRAAKVGEQALGPFTLTIDGKVIKSEKKMVRVIPDEISDVEVAFDRIDVSVGSEFNIEIRTNGRKLNGIRLKRSPFVTAGFVTTTTSSTISGGKTSISNSYKIPLKAVKAGMLEINPDCFEGIESDVKFAQIKIEIKKK